MMTFLERFFLQLVAYGELRPHLYWKIMNRGAANTDVEEWHRQLAVLEEFLKAGLENECQESDHTRLVTVQSLRQCNFDDLRKTLGPVVDEFFAFAWEHREEILQLALILMAL